MTPPFSYDPYEAMNSWASDPEDTSVIRPSDVDEYEYGVSSPYADRAMVLSSQAARSEDNALEYLRASLNKQAEVSNEQAMAAALLAIVPSLGGYMIGKSVGRPELPPGYFEAGGKRSDIPGMNQIAPEYQGGLEGVATGAKSAGGYIGALEADKAQENEVLTKMAQAELSKASRYEQQGASLEAQKIAREDNQAFQREMQGERLDAQKELTRYRQDLRGAGGVEESLASDPEGLAAYQRISMGKGLPGDEQALSPRALKEAIMNQSKATYANSSATRLAGENTILPTAATKQKLDSAMQVKTIGERYISQFEAQAAQDPGWLERNVEKALPATELGELQKSLGLFAVQLRNARENGVMTEQDFQRYSQYLQISSLDTMGSVLARMKELQAVTNLSAAATIKNARLGGENVSNYEQYFNVPNVLAKTEGSPGGAPPGYNPQDPGFQEWKRRNGR